MSFGNRRLLSTPGLPVPPWQRCSLAQALEQLAGAQQTSTPAELGEITLRPHQVEAVELLDAAISRHGGALLADAVGLGKTYTALAVARRYQRIAIAHPAVLGPMWHDALNLTRTRAMLVSWESLSRRPSQLRPDLLILDEAQHARNPKTARYRHVADLAWGAHVLLLSATPLHNSAADLDGLFALFLGLGATRRPELLARVIIRRTRTQERLPTVRHERPLELPGAPQVLEAILALPAPVHTFAQGAAALIQLSLIRQWASSDAALTPHSDGDAS
ncbi:MAG: SNF2-related protein [Gemmatimonadota bacterium]